jgi:predicted enzyme related to lactoylglutathione lyase
VHLELHTGNLAHARDFYACLLGWRPDRVVTSAGTYLTMTAEGDLGAGIVECRSPRPIWLPYVEVDDIDGSTARATELGAAVLLGPREGPAGYRSVIRRAGAGELALWQPKPEGEPAA